MSVIVMIISIIAATGALTWGYAAVGLLVVARWFVVISVLWLLAQSQRWNWFGSLALLVSVAASAIGLWYGLLPSLMVVGAVGALIGWDLGNFRQRMRFAAPTDDLRGIEMRHLARVSIVAALAIVIAAISIFLKVRIPFELAVILALVGTLGLTRLAAWLQRENQV